MALKVLVVDDHVESHGLYHEFLIRKGHKMQIIQSGAMIQAALDEAEIEEAPLQLIILRDSSVIHGYPLIEKLRNVQPILPVLWFTNVSEAKTVLHMIKENVTVVLDPFGRESLKTHLDKLNIQIEAKLSDEELQLSRECIPPYLTETNLYFSLDNNANNISLVIKYILGALDFHRLSQDDSFRVKLGLSETLINAMAHGNLEMSSEELKGKLQNFKQWNKELLLRTAQPKYRNRKVSVEINYFPAKEVIVSVEDEGQGFNYKKVLHSSEQNVASFALYGRGLSMVQATSDSMAFNEKGNKVTLRYKVGSSNE
ncbi:ATP-binding protein [Deltaproteobacteria bacterium TL4]